MLSNSCRQSEWLPTPTPHSERSYKCSVKKTLEMTSKRYRDTDGISSNITHSANICLISSSKTLSRQRNKNMIRNLMSMLMRFCSANSQSPYRMTSALQANRMPEWMKVEFLSIDGIKTNSSWEHNSHSFSMKSPQAKTNARLTALPETTLTNRKNSVVHVSVIPA